MAWPASGCSQIIDATLLTNYIRQFDGLRIVVFESNNRIVSDEPDPLFFDNQNVFVKSYLVSACSILEAFIQDLIECFVNIIQTRINSANFPQNLVFWFAGHEKGEMAFGNFSAQKTKRDISDLVSPNFFKTAKAFERVGVNIQTSDVTSKKDYILRIISKRNKIVHHNDNASDVSLTDIIDVIDNFKEYASILHQTVCSAPHLPALAITPISESVNG